MGKDDLIGTTEAAQMLKVSVRRVQQYVKANGLIAQTIAGSLVFRRGDVMKFKAKPTGRPHKGKK